MTISRLEKLLNKRISEQKYDVSMYEVKVKVEGLVKEVLGENFYVHAGYHRYENRNAIYVQAKVKTGDKVGENYIGDKVICVIYIHKTKNDTYHSFSRRAHWDIKSVSIESYTKKSFEEEYKLAEEEYKAYEKARKEQEEKEQREYEERQKRLEELAKQKAQRFVEYIKEHNLDVGEFDVMAGYYRNYITEINKLLKEVD